MVLWRTCGAVIYCVRVADLSSMKIFWPAGIVLCVVSYFFFDFAQGVFTIFQKMDASYSEQLLTLLDRK